MTALLRLTPIMAAGLLLADCTMAAPPVPASPPTAPDLVITESIPAKQPVKHAGVTPPSSTPLLGGIRPAYPPKLLEAHLGGSTIIDCAIETDGSTSNCSILSITGPTEFAQSALDAIKIYRFLPAVESGVPVRAEHHRFEIKFTPAE